MNLESQIKTALRTIIDPQLRKDIVTLGFVEALNIESGHVKVALQLPGSAAQLKETFTSLIQLALKNIPGITSSDVSFTFTKSKSAIDAVAEGLKGVQHILAVSSCKGGVGKSSTTVNLAFSLSKMGYKVGIFDADVYGPSLPTMVTPSNMDIDSDGQYLFPLEHEGVKLMSFGFLQQNPETQGPAILRGPMVSQIINQLLTATQWGELDFLLVDYPPGTGDVQLTLGQTIAITAAIIVTTPQYISFIDVVKGIDMFDTLKVPTIAVVENMSYFTCPNCSVKHRPFGEGALKKLQTQFGFEHTIEVPILENITESCDNGLPFVLKYPNSDVSTIFTKLSNAVVTEVRKLELGEAKLPNIGYDPDHGILIKYENKDGYNIPPIVLRKNCQCANCVGEFSNKKLIDDSKIPANIYPLSMNPIGNYALGVHWSDNHSSLYPYTVLDSLREKAAI